MHNKNNQNNHEHKKTPKISYLKKQMVRNKIFSLNLFTLIVTFSKLGLAVIMNPFFPLYAGAW